MELRKIDNLWKFLGIKNNLTVNYFFDDGMHYEMIKGSIQLCHHFNPNILKQSTLILYERNYQEKFFAQHYQVQKHRFGMKQKTISQASEVVFFPKVLLSLYEQYDLEIKKDRMGHFWVKIAPFSPKNIYEILDAVNLINRTLWKKNFFAEGIRN